MFTLNRTSVGSLPEIRDDKILEIIVILTIGMGLVLTCFFLYFGQEPYSAMYITPNSIVQNSSNNDVFFIYGVKCEERGETHYNLAIYSGDLLVKNKVFSLKPGETLKEGIRLELPHGTTFPDKISLNLNTSASTKTEEVHFWIR